MTRLKVFLLLVSLFNLISCGQLNSTKTIRLGHGLSTSHSVHKGMLFFGERLEEISGGRFKVQIYPSQQLGTERQCLELLQIGSLDMTKVSAGVLENFSPSIKVFGIPYMFKDKEHTFRVLDGPIGDELLAGTEKYWLKGLGYYDSGSRSFYTINKPIEKPNDLEGLKIRVMESQTAIDMVKSFGGSPTPISWGELYTALQQGVVDGAENNPPSFYLSRHYEVCKYYIIDEHTVLPDVVLMSTHLWNSLNEQEQVWVQKAMDLSVIEQRRLWLESEMESLEAVKAAGVEVSYPDKSKFSDMSRSVADQYAQDPLIKSFIDKIKNTQ
ncbi:MAG: C4-dicarboxylate ABC transporter substrate-binding protein [Flavobacteriaceae bacterium TMED179]|nr:MAG: C4-dicarboxylate ABC transporter substrate-binding protein [Flavobacteriaceae bacterium TMED179]|tara:strand:- start:1612 stop:2589 length:978 start_codon:yes stop_codon:yes gene_type:complete